MRITSVFLSSAFLVLAVSISVDAATIAQYNFDSFPSPLTVSDISGNGHDGVFTAASLNSDNPFSQAGNNSVAVSATNSGSITSPGTINLNNGGSNKFTIEGWVKPSAGQDLNLVSLNSNIGDTINVHLSVHGPTGQAWSNIFVGTNFVLTDAAVLVDYDTWNYLAVVYDGSSASLYIKNNSHPTLYLIEAQSGGPALPNSMNLSSSIASYNSGGSGTALFDDIRISNTALTDAELAYHASFTPPIPEPAALSLVGLGALTMIRRRK
jgi:hypothetical protein